MVGQGLDKTIKTVEIGAFDLFYPTSQSSFAFRKALGLIENSGQFFMEGICNSDTITLLLSCFYVPLGLCRTPLD